MNTHCHRGGQKGLPTCGIPPVSEVLFIQVGLPNLEQAEASRQIACRRARLSACRGMQRVSFGVSRGMPHQVPPSQEAGGGECQEKAGESLPLPYTGHTRATPASVTPPPARTPTQRPSIPHPSRQPRPPPTGDSHPPPYFNQPLPPFNPGDGWPSPAIPGYGGVLVHWRRLKELHYTQAGGLKRGREGRAPRKRRQGEDRTRRNREKKEGGPD